MSGLFRVEVLDGGRGLVVLQLQSGPGVAAALVQDLGADWHGEFPCGSVLGVVIPHGRQAT